MSEQPSYWHLNIPVGSKIIINHNNRNEQMIFYGYNHDKSLVSCFPEYSPSIAQNMLFFPIDSVIAVYYDIEPDNRIVLEQQMEKLRIININ